MFNQYKISSEKKIGKKKFEIKISEKGYKNEISREKQIKNKVKKKEKIKIVSKKKNFKQRK